MKKLLQTYLLGTLFSISEHEPELKKDSGSYSQKQRSSRKGKEIKKRSKKNAMQKKSRKQNRKR